MILNTDTEYKNGPMDLDTRDNGAKVKQEEWESFTMLTATCMKESF